MNQEQNNFNTQGNNGVPNNQPLNTNQFVSYDPQTGEPIYDNQNNSLDDKLLMAYIGNNYQQIMKQKFSVPALFLSWIYTLFRKIYIPSIIGMAAIIILGFLPSAIYTMLVLAFVVVLGINFNKWYVAYAKKQVEKIKISNQTVNENELINICKKKGGTNIWLAILIYAIFAIVSGFLNPNLNNFYNSEDNYYSKVDLLSKRCLGDENNAQAYIEKNVVKIKYDFGSGKSGKIDLEINNPKKLYRLSTNSCDLGTLIVLTEEKDAYAISFKSNTNEITMGDLIRFNKKVNEVRFLGNQMNIEFKYEDNTTESFTYAKIEYDCDSCYIYNNSELGYYEHLEYLIKNGTMQFNLEYDDETLKTGLNLWKFANMVSWGHHLKYVYVKDKEIKKITNFDEVFNYFTEDFEISVMNTNSLTKKSFYEYKEDNIYYGYNGPNERGSNPNYFGTKELKVISETENEIIFNAISSYCTDTNYQPITNPDYECNSVIDTEQKFIIQKVDDYWKIKYFVLPN